MADHPVFASLSRCGQRAATVAVMLLLLQAQGASATDHAPAIARETAWIAIASDGLDARATEALQRIVGLERRLLALRAYLRAGDSLAQRWSWSEQQLTEYKASAEGRTATADINAVAAAFAARNPGATLVVNREPRSLELQLAHWNENVAVGRVAASLTKFLQQRFESRTAPPSAQELRQALIDWVPDVAAPLAAPGLSAHGQGRAFDFEVARDGAIVAGPDVASARRQWDATGWTGKLHAAITAAGRPFEGPLRFPYEPWHYAYTPGD